MPSLICYGTSPRAQSLLEGMVGSKKTALEV
jgi:hypothetical protein